MAAEQWWGDMDLNGLVNCINKLKIPVLAADPGTPADGWIWVNSSSGALKIRVGGTTISVPLTAGSNITVSDTSTLDLTLAGDALSGAVLDSPLLGGQNSAYHRARANHTGTQTASTISDLTTAVQTIVNAMSIDADLIEGQDVDTLIATAIAGVVDTAPGLLDTLNELAAAIGDDPNFATTMTTALGLRDRSQIFTTAGGAATENLDHTFGSRDVVVTCRTNSVDYQDVHFRVTRPTVNRAVLNSDAGNIPAGIIAMVSLKAHA